jgi:hypothetical protein
MRPLRLLGLGLLAAVGTVLLGWWVVPLIGAGRGVARRPGSWPALEAGLSAGLGWGVLLGWVATRGPLWRLAGDVGGLFGLPPAGLIGITLLFGGLLAGSAAALASAVTRPDRRSR